MAIEASKIKAVVCESFGLKESDFVIGTRKTQFSYPRFAYFTLCRHYTLMTLEEIGKSVLLNHSTVSRGLVRHDDLLTIRKVYSDNYRKAEKEVKQLK